MTIGPVAELVGCTVDLGGCVGDDVRRSDAQLRWRADRGLAHPPNDLIESAEAELGTLG
jgi:hypothetical protein